MFFTRFAERFLIENTVDFGISVSAKVGTVLYFVNNMQCLRNALSMKIGLWIHIIMFVELSLYLKTKH